MLSKLVFAFGLSETCNALQNANAAQLHGGTSEHDDQFQSFIREQGRSYKHGSDEYVSRRELFKMKMAKIDELNSNPSLSWKAGMNKFTDRTEEELATQHGYNRNARSLQKPLGYGSSWQFTRVSRDGLELPKEVDYAHLKGMQKSEVMDQQNCGSCWAVATALTLRAHSELYTKDTIFSAQELVSCTPNPKHCGGTGGCSGATGELAFEYVLQNGLRTSKDFPYTATDEACPKALNSGGGKSIGMSSWRQLPTNELKPLQEALATKGPLAVSVAADEYWFYYMGGVMDSCSNDDPIVNHLVVLIGYGTDQKKQYWKIQNSWGSSWGENGHMRLLRTDDEEKFCGMDTKPQDGVACEGENDPVKVCGHCGVLYDASYPLFE